MDKLLTIPEEIRVGFQKREDTYTGQLAFVIRKERTTQQSWETWRDKDLRFPRASGADPSVRAGLSKTKKASLVRSLGSSCMGRMG